MDVLYSEAAETMENLNEIRWKLFGWIMAFNDEIVSAIKRLPKKFLLIGATLYTLVKVINLFFSGELVKLYVE